MIIDPQFEATADDFEFYLTRSKRGILTTDTGLPPEVAEVLFEFGQGRDAEVEAEARRLFAAAKANS